MKNILGTVAIIIVALIVGNIVINSVKNVAAAHVAPLVNMQWSK